jgi:hypothetical protein
MHGVTGGNDPSISRHVETLTTTMICLQSSSKFYLIQVALPPGAIPQDRVPCRTGYTCLHYQHAPSHRSQG